MGRTYPQPSVHERGPAGASRRRASIPRVNQVSPRARLGADVEIGRYTIVHDDVEIEEGTTVGSHCVLGEPARGAEGPLRIGPRSTIRSHSTLYAGSTLGEGLATGHGVLVREGARVGRHCQI